MTATRTRRWGEGKAAVVRHLYAAHRPITQVVLANIVGVSQPAVSQYLSALRSNGDVSFTDPGWVANRARLAGSYWGSFASRFHSQTCWYRIDDPTQQVADLTQRRPDLLISGDVGADLIAPWKVPTVAIAYGDVDHALLDDLGFVRAESPGTASLLIRPVPDRRIAAQAVPVRQQLVVPHLHLAADLLGLGGDDRVEASNRIASASQ